MALAAQFVKAAIPDASQQERSLALFAQWGGTVPQSGEDILYGIFRLVFVAQQDVGCLNCCSLSVIFCSLLSIIQMSKGNHYPYERIFSKKEECLLQSSLYIDMCPVSV